MHILYEDAHLIAVEKPQNCPVQPDKTGTLSLMDRTKDHYEFMLGKPLSYLGLVHRLDRHTGGVVVFAKTPNAAKKLSAIFASHEVDKRYATLVEGAIASNEATLSHTLLIDEKLNFVKVVPPGTPGGKEAKLSYRLVHMTTCEDGPLSLLEIRLHTGRQHQIRVQMAQMGHPVLGDEKYGAQYGHYYKKSMHLWATDLSFRLFGKKYHFHSDAPFSAL